MSRLSELIAELCPDGVEYRTLGEVGQFLRGSSFQKKHFTEAGVPCIHYGQVHTRFGVSTNHVVSYLDESFAARMKHAQHGDLIIATTSEDDEAVGKATAWMGDFDVVVSNDAFIYRHTLDPMYVSHFFASDQFQQAKMPFITGAKVRRLSGEDMSKICIPVPPIEVQREIVRILDSFRELDDSMAAEIESRTRQFEHYRDALLGSRLTEYCPNGVDYKALGEVAPFVRERANTDEAQFDAYVGVDALLQNKEGRDLTKTDIPSGRHVYFRPGDTLVGNIRPYLKKIWYADCFGGTNGDVLVFRSTDSLETKYLYHVLASDVFFDYDNGHAKGSKMPRGDKGFIKDYRIPVPPIEVQREIVSMLDSFQLLIVVMNVERDVRRKQFAYYRDKLLDFPKKVTT